MTSRTAADAADTAIAATQADRRSALSLATITNQPASQLSSGAAPSRITRIIRASKTQYTVQWSEPVGNPAIDRVGKEWMNKQAAYIDVVNEFRAREAAVEGAAEAEEQLEEADVDAAADAAEENGVWTVKYNPYVYATDVRIPPRSCEL